MTNEEYQAAKAKREKRVLAGGAALILLILFGVFILYPVWNVWASEKSGEAAYSKATQDRNIMILEATAREEAARHNYNVTVIPGMLVRRATSTSRLASSACPYKRLEGSSQRSASSRTE